MIRESLNNTYKWIWHMLADYIAKWKKLMNKKILAVNDAPCVGADKNVRATMNNFVFADNNINEIWGLIVDVGVHAQVSL